MKDFPIIWLLFNTKLGRIILGVLIAYIIVSLVGWWLLPVILALIAAFLLYVYYSTLESQRDLIKKKNEDLQLSKRRIQEQEKKYKKVLDAYPKALKVEEVSDSYFTYHFYYFAIGKARKRADFFENDFIKARFDIAEDCCGIIVTITNISDRTISIDWPSFVINSSRVHIDGVLYLDYKTDEGLAPNETVTKLLQLHKLYFSKEFKRMFYLYEINQKEIKYDVKFNIRNADDEVIPLMFNLYTVHKNYKIEKTDGFEYYSVDDNDKIVGIVLLIFALLFTFGLICYNNRDYLNSVFRNDSSQMNEVPLSPITSDPYTPPSDSKVNPPSSSSGYDGNNEGDDNMRGFDPASEDDMDDNGMTRYMENTDDEGWN